MAAPAPPGAPQGVGRSRRFVVMGLGLVVALLAAALIVQRGDDGGDDLGTGEIFLEAAGAVGSEPFTEGADVNEAPAPLPRPRVEATTAGAQATGRAIRSVEGASAGLYAAARGVASCDVGRLAGQLEADTARSQAWARAAGIAKGRVRDHLRGLTSLVLRADTRVTDHGFREDRAVARQAVLEAGTAVLVDAFGAPAVRCAGGTPLQAPEPARPGADYTGRRWEGFRPEATIVVTRAPAPVEQFVVVDLTAPGFFTRPVGNTESSTVEDGHVFLDTVCELFPEECHPPGLEPPAPVTGPAGEDVAVKIELRWFSTADLDLAVTDPSGATVRYDSPSVASGGTLSADTNGGCRAPTGAPVETVTWPAGQAVPGDYEVTVSYYDVCPGGTGAQAYELAVSGPGVTVVDAGDGGREQAAPGRRDLTLVAHVTDAGGPGVFGRQALTGTLGGAGDSESTRVSVGRTFTLPPLPGPVLGLAASVNEKGLVLVNWAPNPDPSFGAATSYAILATATIDGEERATEYTIASTRVEHPDLPPGGTVDYIVVAENAAGSSEPMYVSITTPEAPEPEAPTGPREETLDERCNRLYGPPPPPFERPSNMMWTLCMHDPTTDDVVPSEGPPPAPD